MIGRKPRWMWKMWTISWKYISPIVLLVRPTSDTCHTRPRGDLFGSFKAVIIATIIIKGKELSVNRITYPAWAHGIGWVIVVIPFIMIVGCAIGQAIIHKYNWVCAWPKGQLHAAFFFSLVFFSRCSEETLAQPASRILREVPPQCRSGTRGRRRGQPGVHR